MKWWFLGLLVLAVAGGLLVMRCRRKAVATAPPATFLAKTYVNARGERLNYRLLAPMHYASQQAYPIIFFLHGAAERGSDNAAQLRYVAPVFTDPMNRNQYPCFVYLPQCPAGTAWVYEKNGHDDIRQSKALRLAEEALAQIKHDYHIDRKRVYISGLSMGGSATWYLAARAPDRFAAAVPMCGCGNRRQASRLVHMPIWVFHGTKDSRVNVGSSRGMVSTIRRAGGHPRYTEYPDLAHNCWSRALREPELFPWLFSKRSTKDQ